jgi:hypothetical protein
MMDSLYACKCKRFRNNRHTVTFGIPVFRDARRVGFRELQTKLSLSSSTVALETLTIRGRTRCVFLHYDSSKQCTRHLNKFI